MSETILVVGGGGREHALADRLARCERVARVVVCPGNAGIAGAGLEARSGDALAMATQLRPDLVVIGPEAPLCEGLADQLRQAGFLTYGPSRAAAELEASKAFMKDFAVRHGIRTARHVEVSELGQLSAALEGFETPPVIKATGLCAGKGVTVAESFEEAEQVARSMLSGEAFGDAGRKVVIEERLVGQELSVHAICDGERAFVLPAIQDHKRIGEGDTGPNTGGMGTYGPTSLVDEELALRIEEEIVRPIVDGMRKDGRPFVGTLFAGLMVSPAGEPALIEVNVRFGDPETQVLVNLIDGDFAGLLASAARGELQPDLIELRREYGMCVVMSVEGYPQNPRKGDVISGLAEAGATPGVKIYHAGTRRVHDALLTAGGRVLGVTATAPTLEQAKERAYAACRRIHFDGAYYRRDIGHRQLGTGGA